MRDRSHCSSRREFLRQTAALAVAAAVGCDRREHDLPGQTTLDFYTYATPEFLALFRDQLIPGFEKANPSVHVRSNESLGDAGYDAKLLTLIAGKLPPDLFHVTQQNFPFYAAKGILQPLDDLLAQDNDLHADDFFPQVMEGMRFQGKLYGLPSDFSTIIMFYNKDLFDRYRVPYPREDWTWDDYLDTAKALTKDFDNDGMPDVYGTLVETAYNRWPAWVWANGGEILNKDLTRCEMDSPESIGALQWYLDLAMKYHVSPRMDQRMGQDAEDLFAAQRVAMQADSRYGYKRFRRDGGVPFKFDVCPMPKGKTRATTFIWGGNCILKSTKHLKESWEFLKFMSGPQGAAINLAMGNALPAYRKAAEQAIANSKSDPLLPEHDHYFLDAVSYGRIAPNPPQYANYVDAMDDFEDALLHGSSVADACRDFTKNVNQLLNAGVF